MRRVPITTETGIVVERLEVASESDLTDVRNLLGQLSEGLSDLATDECIQTVLSKQDVHWLVARDKTNKGSIIGMAMLILAPLPYYDKALIEAVVVDKPYRRMGIGETLNRELIQIARSWGVAMIQLTSRPAREEANHLYPKLGFTLIAQAAEDVEGSTNLYELDLRGDQEEA